MPRLAFALAGLIVTPLLALPPPALPAPPHAQMPPGTGPIQVIHAHLCGFHFYNGDMKRALRVHHYCSHLNEDVLQCVIYDSDAANARLIGIEYIISEARFNQLAPEEKKLWHSHRYEVMSGQLIASGLPDAAEQRLMQELVSTYGKTWHLWQVDRGDPLPLGLPKLMMGFTADGQADPRLLADRDRESNRTTAQVRARRAALAPRPVAAGADDWQSAPAFQISDDLLPPTPAAPKP